MEILQQDRERQTVLQRVRNTARSGYEHVRDNVTAYMALGAAAVTLAATVELVTPEPVNAKKPPRPAPKFEPGQYVGTSNQTCPPRAAETGMCVEGEKMPVRFTANKNKIIDFTAPITTTCRAGAKKIGNGSFWMEFDQIKLDERHQFSAAELVNPGDAQSAAEGSLHGAKAEGGIGFAVELNNQGERATNGGIYCQSDFITFEAERVS